MSPSIRQFLSPLLAMHLAASAAAVQNFSFPVKLSARDAAASRQLTITAWRVDKRGVPSFDYSYSQVGRGCEYRRVGHAQASFTVYQGILTLDIYNPQDENGKESEQIGLFEDEVNGVDFSMPVEGKAKAFWVSFDDPMMKKSLGAKCGFSKRGDAVMLRK
jgi:hypothetical protein